MAPVLQAGTIERAELAAVQIVGLALAAAVVAAIAAVLYRHRTTRPFPTGLAGFLGLATVGCWTLADVLLRGSAVSSLSVDHYGSALYVVLGATLGVVFGTGGRRLGDWVACEVFGIDRLGVDGERAELLRSARTLVPATVPDRVSDADGYAPAADATKRDLAGTRFLFPSRLSDAELADRLESRIVTDFDVDHATVALDEEGDVESLSVGNRPSGLGVTLPPGTAAVAIAADPSSEGSSGDPVEIWEMGATNDRLVARGRLRSTTGDRATVVVDEDDLTAFDPDQRYRLVTPPAAPSDHHRLAALLRSVDETTIPVTVTEDDDLVGEFVGWLPGVALALERGDETVPVPDDRVTLRAGDTVYLVGRPADFERHEAAFESQGAAPADDELRTADRTGPDADPIAGEID